MKRKWLEPTFIVDIAQVIIAIIAAIVLGLDSTGLIELPWIQNNLLNLVFIAICTIIVSSVLERRFTFRSIESKIEKRLDEVDNKLEVILSGVSGEVSADFFLKDRSDFLRLENMIVNAKEVCVVGKSLVGVVSLYSTMFLKLAKQGCKFKFLVENPSNYEKDERVDANITHTLHLLSRVKQEVPSNIEIRITSAILHYSILMVDRKSKSGQIQVELYSYRVATSDRPHLSLLSGRDSKWYKFYESQFESAWNDAEVYENVSEIKNAG
jgi:hypothetical protein